MFRLVIVTTTFLFLSSCTKVYYTHPWKTPEDFERDKYECEKIAEQSAAAVGASGNIPYIVMEVKRCLELKYGWKPVEK